MLHVAMEENYCCLIEKVVVWSRGWFFGECNVATDEYVRNYLVNLSMQRLLSGAVASCAETGMS